ncbi:mitochondrial carrier domain-containing protein [Blyttiomyces helicus]|uniref:Mitochondrial carrier domain-containing protein n=1 Tax=Blyttiomyces helicus TaxID=388810 RepID=A0A4P9WAH5_9FUNG|nr:mitochondrial carrier domain-containing protein [Blyttiomyces helicus]|eukprot:RKO87860.1 mitochondrial carrier domain-containing protein [Blyttiomyces helicus]
MRAEGAKATISGHLRCEGAGTVVQRIPWVSKSSECRTSDLIWPFPNSSTRRITRAEFIDYVTQKEIELWKIFRQIDRNNNDAILPSDLRASLKEAGVQIRDSELESFITHIDRDNDGVIDFPEWRDFFLLLPHKPTLQDIYKLYSGVYGVDFNSDSFPLPEVAEGRGLPHRLNFLIAGGIAGAISRTATAPLDRLKVFLVTQTYPQNPPKSRAESAYDAIRILYRDGGFRSFYRGNGLNVVKIAPESALKFFVFEWGKSTLAGLEGVDKDNISVASRFAAGGLGGLLSQFAIYPLETLKTRIMAQTTVAGASIVLRTARALWKEGGVRPFYRGCGPSLVGIVPYAGIDLAVFETLKVTTAETQSSTEIPMMAILCCGMVSGAFGATLMYPLSLVRTRLQAQGTPLHPERYSSVFDVVRKTHAREGVFGFYKGLVPTLLKVIPAVSISYVVYERCKVGWGGVWAQTFYAAFARVHRSLTPLPLL